MPKHYNKLVRDRIPEIIGQSGRNYEIEIMDDLEYRHALLAKIAEEAQEAVEAPPDRLVTELADLYEIIEAVMVAFKLDRAEVMAVKEKRFTERGGFERRIRLLWAD